MQFLAALISDGAIRTAHLIVVLITTATTLQEFTLFSLHPILMALFLSLSAEAAMSFSKKSRRLVMASAPAADGSGGGGGGKADASEKDDRVDKDVPDTAVSSRSGPTVPRSIQVEMHVVVAFAAVGCALLGFAIEYYIKGARNKKHFKTIHGILGLAVFALALLQATAGYLNRQFPPRRLSAVQRRLLWRVHRWAGAVILPAVSVVCLLHMATATFGAIGKNWMSKNEYFAGWGLIGQAALLVGMVGTVARVLQRQQ
ncbi:hypothetical protein DFJ73DRAFT_868110 [Zopfochytrium polystomum]|nr:hypothetical protein DFJ73DRAFT_868110 [Zopfochytrium polystomum]